MEIPVPWEFVNDVTPSRKRASNKSVPDMSHTPSLRTRTTKLVLDQRSGPDINLFYLLNGICECSFFLHFSLIGSSSQCVIFFFCKWQTMVAFQLACSRGSILSESPEPSVLDKYFSE